MVPYRYSRGPRVRELDVTSLVIVHPTYRERSSDPYLRRSYRPGRMLRSVHVATVGQFPRRKRIDRESSRSNHVERRSVVGAEICPSALEIIIVPGSFHVVVVEEFLRSIRVNGRKPEPLVQEELGRMEAVNAVRRLRDTAVPNLLVCLVQLSCPKFEWQYFH